MPEKVFLNQADFELSCRVYYEDTDSQGILYHGRCMNFFERARTEWVRSLGIRQSEWLQRGLGFVVSQAQLHYVAPAFFDEEVVSTVHVKQVKRVQILMDQYLIRKDASAVGRAEGEQEGADSLVRASFRIAFVDLNTFRPVAIPSDMLSSLRSVS